MANATLGEPLGYRNAVILQSAQTVRGTAVTPASACGIATAHHTKRTTNHEYRGPGSPNLVARKGGLTSTDWELRFPAVQSGIKTLLQRGTRTAGVLPYFTLGLGYQDDVSPTPNKDCDQIQDCKVGKLKLGLDASKGPAPLTATLGGHGGLVTDLTSLAPVVDTTTPYWTYEGVFTRAGVGYEIRKLELDVNHHLSEDTVIPGAAPTSFLRGWKYLSEREEDITGTIQRYRPSGTNVQADSLVLATTLILVLTNIDDATTLTVTLNSVDYGDETVGQDPDGIFWTFPFTAKTWALT